MNLISEFDYWKICEDGPTEPFHNRKYWNLEKQGYQGYYVNSSSAYEITKIKNFVLETKSFYKKSVCEDYHELIGEFNDGGCCIYTKENSLFSALLKTIPVRNKVIIFALDSKKKKFKNPNFNYAYIVGDKAIALSYSLDNLNEIEKHDILMQLTLMKLMA